MKHMPVRLVPDLLAKVVQHRATALLSTKMDLQYGKWKVQTYANAHVALLDAFLILEP